jgi:hypothetical protein
MSNQLPESAFIPVGLGVEDVKSADCNRIRKSAIALGLLNAIALGKGRAIMLGIIDSATVVNAGVNAPNPPFACYDSVSGCILFYCRVN